LRMENGTEGLDRDKINKIIMETSKGSRFYENELKREQQVNQRIEKMMLQKAKITEEQLRKQKLRDCPELKDKPMAVGSMSMLVSSRTWIIHIFKQFVYNLLNTHKL
uniref:Polymerase (DNA directed) kappa n=1 Tax=Sphaeramia orbicularis TaxID=375764 RepID=A0A673C1X2_9TELE